MKKRILVAPLNWGLGHATRCIPIIDFCLKEGHEVFIGGNGVSFSLLREEFPEASFLEYPSLEVNYSPFFGFYLSIISQLPKFIIYLKKEKRFTEKLVKRYKIDAIISDNRYGVYSELIPSAIVTHQLIFKTKFLGFWLTKIVNSQLGKFNQCWIPDNADRVLSGELSTPHNKTIIPRFIGGLSRFFNMKKQETVIRDFLIVLSGPEPNRTHFEKRIISILSETDYAFKLVRGTDLKIIGTHLENVSYINKANSMELLKEINQSKYIISRSGYSSILDLTALNKKAILIPTKGQIEQEYLSKLHNKKGLFICFDENKIDLNAAILYFNENKGKQENNANSKIEFGVIREFLNL